MVKAPSNAERRLAHRQRRRRGSTTVEFAVLLPLLLTVALLCVDFGRFAHYFIAVKNAARTGAGFGSTHRVTTATRPVWNAAIRQKVQDELDENSWFAADQLMVATPQIIDEGDGFSRVRVEVSYAFHTLVNWPFLPGYNDPIALRHVAVMRTTR